MTSTYATTNIEVATFGRYGRVTVPLPKSGRAGDLLQALANQLSLKPSSVQCFALFSGRVLGSPEYRLEKSDDVTKYAHICLQKHGIDRKREQKLIRTDDVAVHLIFSEVLVNYKRNEMSTLEPTEEERERMEEALDPSFVSERQFLETAVNVKGYTSIPFYGGVVSRIDIQNNDCTIKVGTSVLCVCAEENLIIKTVGSPSSSNEQTEWNWRQIRRWRFSDLTTATFEVTNVKGNAHMLECIHIAIPSAEYFLQTARFICMELVYKANPSKRPVDGPINLIVGKTIDPLSDFLNTALYGTGPNFTSIH